MSKLQTKNCIICGLEKPIINFYPSGRNKSGIDNRCKECHCAKARATSLKNYNSKEGRLKYLIRKKLGNHIVNGKLMGKKYPEKYNARSTLRYAVKVGKIIKLPCEVCGDKKSEGHHEDYTKPLEVKWLCMKHHKELHRKLLT